MFVSAEKKADWLARVDKQEVCLRPELVEEYRRASEGQSFYLITPSELLQWFDAPTEVVRDVQKQEQEWLVYLGPEDRTDPEAGRPFDGHLICGSESFPVEGRLIRYTNGKNGWYGNFFVSDQAPIEVDEVYSLVLDEGRRGRIKIVEPPIGGGGGFAWWAFLGLGELERNSPPEWTR